MRQPKSTSKSSNPLKLLSEKLGSTAKPVSMEKIGRLTNVAPSTLRLIELGWRTFSPEIQERMRQRGLDWDSETGQWFFTYDHQAELSLYLLETFNRLGRGDAVSQDHDAHVACEKVISLLREVAVVDYTNLLLDLNASLDRLRETYKVEGSKEIFEQRSLKYWVRPTASGGQQLVKGFSSSNFPAQLLNFSDKRKFIIQWDEAERAEQGPSSSTVQPAA
jgi:hypothetical protein